jgi:predicted kinase
MPKCIMLVGVPASGKSTWQYKKYGEYPPVVASTDNIIQEIASSYGMTYDEGFKGLIQIAEQIMWRQITTCLMRGSDFIIDRTNLSVKSRKKFIDKLKLHHYNIECVVFPLPGTEKLSSDEWNRRLNSRRGKTIPGYILSSMIEHYEPPTLAEGFSKITEV